MFLHFYSFNLFLFPFPLIRSQTILIKISNWSKLTRFLRENVSLSPTLCATGSPKSRVGQDLLVFVDGLVVVQVLGAAHPAGVEPVVGSYSDGHETECAECPRRGQKHHHPPVANPHVGLFHLVLKLCSFTWKRTSGFRGRSELVPNVLCLCGSSWMRGARIWRALSSAGSAKHIKLRPKNFVHKWILQVIWPQRRSRGVGVGAGAELKHSLERKVWPKNISSEPVEWMDVAQHSQPWSDNPACQWVGLMAGWVVVCVH